MTAEKRIDNLDGLRFIAAAVVAVTHFDIISELFGYKPIGGRFFSNAAQIAVTFFFVLSGFLITWLLLKEKLADAGGRISIRRFYLKRIRRIWPLYYLLVLLTFFVFREFIFFGGKGLADDGFFRQRLTGYLLFLPNYTEYVYGPEFYLGQTWSLGVEEFFYLFFPIGLYFISKRNILQYLLVLATVFFLLSVAAHFLNKYAYSMPRLRSIVFVFFDKYRIYSFAAGGIGAWMLLHKDHPVTKRFALLTKKTSAGLLLFLLVILLACGITFSFLTQQAYAMLFALFMYASVSSGARFSFLNNPVMVYLGRISYGIYMLHPVAIISVFWLVGVDKNLPTGMKLMWMMGALLLTILFAAVSYELFEKFFLRKRKTRPTG